jgi:hypothetical protein
MMQRLWLFISSANVFLIVTVPLLLFWLIPIADAKLRPPVKHFEITSVERQGENVYIEGWMVKSRGRFAGVTIIGTYADGVDIQLPLVFMDNDTDHTGNRVPGRQLWGPWRVRVVVPPNPASVITLSVLASHRLPAFGISARWAEYSISSTLISDFPIPQESP